MSGPGRHGCSLVELVVALGVAAAVAVGATAALATALRHLARTSLRAEADDVLAIALEAFTLDVRRAGFDPRGAGVEPVAEASGTRLRLRADLDGDGAVDGTSEEETTIACDVGGGRLSRIVGTQSLPLANGVTACAFAYTDANGTALPPPAGGLDAAARRRVRAATLDVAIRPPGASAPASRRATVALRAVP